MECFICGRSTEEMMYLKLPLETKYQDMIVHIVGNVLPEEYVCLPCVGFQYDDIQRKRVV